MAKSTVPPFLDNLLEGLPGLSFFLPEMSILGIINYGAAAAMVFGGVVPFIPQYRDIRRSGNAEGFSTFVCLNLLVANILRILFWFGKHFELPLLAQSVIMVFTMLALVQLCVHVKQKSEIVALKQHKFTANCQHSRDKGPPQRIRSSVLDFDHHYFWQWTDFASYVEFTLFFTVVVGLLTYFLLDNMIYVEMVGFLAVFCEAMLGAPQFYRNFTNKSTHGMSKKMVGFWTCGDIFKTGYFIMRKAPAQFWICGMLQVSIDISIFIQVYIYRNLPTRVSKSAVS